MQVLRDDWSVLFRLLKQKISPASRKGLMTDLILDLKEITKGNFGTDGSNRTTAWQGLSPRYAKRVGRQNPTLILTPPERIAVGKSLDKPHLLNQFRHAADSNSASLTNDSAYADNHQFGKTIPARPFYPVSANGETLAPVAEIRVQKILDEHFQP